MRIGVDLDNTILCYDRVFHNLGLEYGWIGLETEAVKKVVRDTVRALPQGDDKWQELQAQAYGPRLSETEFFHGVEDCFSSWREQGHEVFIVSHKTRHSGKSDYDLHQAAMCFLVNSPLVRKNLLSPEHIFFCVSRADKLAKIRALDCRVFIDDLQEVFLEPDFPVGTRKIHFAPDEQSVSPPDALVCRFWQEIADYDPGLDAALLELAGASPRRLVRLGGGRNSRVWRLETVAQSCPVLLKQYHQPGKNTRNRLGAESRAFALLHKHGFRCVPKVIALAPERGLALYSLLEGEGLLANKEEDLIPFVRLVADLWKLSRSLSATPDMAEASAAPAAEACTSLRVLREQVTTRFTRLCAQEADSINMRNMQAFVRDTLTPLWYKRLDKALQGYALLGRSPDAELPADERILSPSDFGCHNAIRQPDGTTAFVDFEYFGWDDPVKLMADFVLHPAMSLDEKQQDFFLRGVLPLFENTDASQRLPLLRPLFAVKWSCILLNEFLSADSTTRHFTAGHSSMNTLRETQLAKARMFAATH